MPHYEREEIVPLHRASATAFAEQQTREMSG
jgi:hypothetical protein